MPRKPRRHPDYGLKNYTYAATIVGPIPQAVWDTGRSMQALWNQCVELYDALPDERPRGWLGALEAAAYALCKAEGTRAGLSGWCKMVVFDRFMTTLKRSRQHQGGPPTAHHGLRRLYFPTRPSQPDTPPQALARLTTRTACAILPPDEGHHHQRAYLRVGGVLVPLLVNLHRPLPPTGFVKVVALAGQFEPSLRRPGEDGWQWTLQVVMELPPPPARPAARRVCGLDLGWRVREGGLRIAVVTDGRSTWEWLLPFDLAGSDLRRRQRFFAAHGERLEATSNWRELWTRQEDIDLALEQCKDALRQVDTSAWPDDALASLPHLTRMRASGLRRLVRTLHTAGLACPPLEAWEPLHTARVRRLRAGQLRVSRIKRHTYRLLAHWLAAHYDVVAVEGDLSLKALAEQETRGEHALAEAQKYRQMAGLSLLKRLIGEQCRQAGRTLLACAAAYTTRTCATCGAVQEVTAALYATCPNGHREDVDVTAASNLYAEVAETARTEATAPPPAVPPDLQRFLHRLM
jgi:hypothetical protein